VAALERVAIKNVLAGDISRWEKVSSTQTNEPLTFAVLDFAGLSTWGKRVGRKLDQMKLGESSDRLHYVVTPASPEQQQGGGYFYGRGGGSESELLHEMGRARRASASDNETVEFLVVNDDLILHRKQQQQEKQQQAISQPDLAVVGAGELGDKYQGRFFVGSSRKRMGESDTTRRRDKELPRR